MMSYAYIQQMSDTAGNRARRRNAQPRVFKTFTLESAKRIPNLGSYRPSGWSLQEDKLVDSTGMGASDEPAMTHRQFVEWVNQNPGDGFGLLEAGQFQVVIGRFHKTDTP